MIELISYDREPVSLDQTVGDDGESALGDFVASVDPREEPSDSFAAGRCAARWRSCWPPCPSGSRR